MQPHHTASWFRHGDLTDAAAIYPALTSAPSTAAHGIAVPANMRDELSIVDITSIAAGAHTFTLIVWGYKHAVGIYNAVGTWVPITDGTRGPGWSNISQVACSSLVTTDRSGHQVQGSSGYARLAAQVTAATGAPAVWVDFGFSPHQED